MSKKETWLSSVYKSIRLLSQDFELDVESERPKTLEEQMRVAVQAAIPRFDDLKISSWQEYAQSHFDFVNPENKLTKRKHFASLVAWQDEDKSHVVLSPDKFIHDPWNVYGLPAGIDIDRFLPRMSKKDQESYRYAARFLHNVVKSALDLKVSLNGVLTVQQREFGGVAAELAAEDRGVLEAWKLRQNPELPVTSIHEWRDVFRVNENIKLVFNVFVMPERLEEDNLTPEEQWLKRECIPHIGKVYLNLIYSW